jgi:hypothetical protein
MKRKNKELDQSFQKFLKTLDVFKWKFGEYNDDEDDNGIDGHLYINHDISISLRCREINKDYGMDAVGWTSKWINGEPGEFFYSKEEMRVHGWQTNKRMKKIMFIKSDKETRMMLNRLPQGYSKFFRRKSNGQEFVMFRIEKLREYDLIHEEIIFE